MRLILGLSLTLSALAQQLPDAAALERLSADLLKTHSSVQYVSETVSESTTMGQTRKDASTATYRSVPPGRVRIETTNTLFASVSIFDGATWWNYQPARNEYSRQSTPGTGLEEQLKALGIDSPDALRDVVKVVRSDVIEIDGQTRECWVTEMRALPGLLGGMFSEFLLTSWIDKQHGLALRTEVSMAMTIIPTKTKTVTTLRDLKFDEPLPAALFEFTPPPDAKELMLPKVDPGQVSKQLQSFTEPARVDVPPGKPQAFVPFLRPLRPVFPEYPEGPLPYSVVRVEFLLTVDTAGQVAEAEVLMGNAAYRGAALAAIKRSRYRPVLRNGMPVYAYTRATVTFFSLSAGEYKAEPLDLTAVRTLADRMVRLERTFPRSPLQVLEDVEQDVTDATAVVRRSALPELTRAAYLAGRLSRASAYANEMLQEGDDGQPRYNGHHTLGLIALRNGDVEQAKRELLDAATTKGSPALGSFGPNMTLANELLEKGERETVLEFFKRCATFWKSGQAKLDNWSATVRAGGMPDFGANLNY